MQKPKFLNHGIIVARRILGLFFLCMFLLKPQGGVIVAQLRTLTLVVFLIAGVRVLSLPPPVQAASCEAIVGKWAWFIGGEVTVNPDGTFIQQSGNAGTWECTDAARGAVTLRWRQGGFVNRMMLSPDGRGLSSTDPSQSFVTAKRIGTPPLPRSSSPGAAPKTTPSSQPQPKTAQEPRQAQTGSPQVIPRLQWKFELRESFGSSPISTSPTVADGVVYVSYSDGLYAIDTKSGQEKWAFPKTGVRCSPAVADGVAYVCDSGALSAVDIKTGRQLWELETYEIIGTNTPVVANGLIYLGSRATEVFGELARRDSGKRYGRLFAVDAKTGQRKLAIKVEASFSSAPAVTDGIIYVGRSDGQLYAVDESSFDRKTRRQPTIWTFKTGGSIDSSPAVADGIVYVGSNDSHLYAVDIKTHQEKWRFKTGGEVPSSPKVADGVVYVGSHDNHLYAVDAKTGREKWRFKTGGIVSSSPAVAASVVYVGSKDSHLYAVDAETGREKWRFKTGGAVFSSPAVADGVVYVGSNDGYLYAIK